MQVYNVREYLMHILIFILYGSKNIILNFGGLHTNDINLYISADLIGLSYIKNIKEFFKEVTC